MDDGREKDGQRAERYIAAEEHCLLLEKVSLLSMSCTTRFNESSGRVRNLVALVTM